MAFGKMYVMTEEAIIIGLGHQPTDIHVSG
jgi:hypothetical protein